ncbi:MAG: hypothetical protein ACFFDN_50420 [Candidatus Hodarchaeota archaeon]
MDSEFDVKDEIEFSHEKCPLCNKRLFLGSNGKLICKNCETDWIFDPETGIVKFANFYVKKNQ